MQLSADIATESDAAAIASLRTAVADDLTRLYGRGHWSFGATEKGVVRGITTSKVLVARTDGHIVGTLRLATKKPWAIDAKYFAAVHRPLYLIDMAVEPGLQRHGIGRFLLEEARLAARAWRGDGIRLDAYDAPAGAGGFYARCGFREVGRVSYRGVPLIYFEWLSDAAAQSRG
jgi:GNAT superfamily N-acetyltransferase